MTPRLDVLRTLTHSDESIKNVVYHEVQIYDKREYQSITSIFSIVIMHCLQIPSEANLIFLGINFVLCLCIFFQIKIASVLLFLFAISFFIQDKFISMT